MTHATHRPTPLRRLLSYRAPRIGSMDADYGPYTGHPDDPRYCGPSECPECGGGKRNPEGDPCEWCGGTGHYWENEE